MYGLFLQTEQTLRLLPKATPLKEFPQMCCRGSLNRPDLFPEVNEVIPQLVKSGKNLNNIPLFAPMRINNGHLELIDLSRPTNDKFCLVFYPDPERPPVDTPIVKEYWSSIKPMVICRDVGGYYLGVPEDPCLVLFRLSENQFSAHAWISRALSGFNESLSYGSPEFSLERIYLRRDRSR